MTIMQQDIIELSDIIEAVTGFGLDSLLEDGRVKSDVMPTKVALCHYLAMKKYSVPQIAKVLNCARTSVYHYLKCHNDMSYSDRYYRRCIEAIDEKLKDTRYESY